LFGAATGGLVFGWLGDRFGRSLAMAASILTYSVLSAATSMAQSPAVLCGLWFLACTGVGGIWPNGVALLAEAWSGLSRPAVAGVIGTAANIGIFLFATLAAYAKIDVESWRWAFLVGAGPVVLGLLGLFIVPESPRWLAARLAAFPVAASNAIAVGEPPLRAADATPTPTTGGIFQPPLLKITLLAIVLATVPIIGGWGTANWMVPWAEDVAGPIRKAEVQQARAFTGLISSLLGAWIAAFVGRRTTYFAVSVASLALAQYIFAYCSPADDAFLIWVAALGFASGIYFGWLPLCLPELFPTRVRSTGAGVGFNFGRIATAVTIFVSGALSQMFGVDHARIGQLTSLLFVVGMVAIWLAPDTSEKQLED
jgi:MFS family permease